MIRPATADDLPALIVLEADVFGDGAWSEDLLAARVGHTLVAGSPQLCGSVTVTVAGDLADLERVAVAPGWRRTGLGRALLAHALEVARAAGAERMLLEVREDNIGALAFYTASGFTEIDRRRRYYRDGADALVMAREV